MKYKILEHPAELRLRIYGKTIEELFINAAEALMNTLKRDAQFKEVQPPQINRQCLEVEPLNIKSIDINSLLVDFLSEILAKSQINKRVYKVIKLKVYKEKRFLEAGILGIPIERFDEDIKAVTYQDVDIQQTEQIAKRKGQSVKTKLWQTDLVLDI